MMEVFEETQSSVIATQVVEGKAISAYGVLDAKPVNGKFQDRLFEVSNMVEKPRLEDAPSNLAIIGRYILTPGIFEALEHTPLGTGGELQLTQALRPPLDEAHWYYWHFAGLR